MSGVSFAIFGTGRMAAAMMDTFRCDARVKVLSVASHSKARAENFAAEQKIESAFDDMDAMCGDERIDAVYIANENARHAQASVAALKAGKHVLCEKPFALTRDEGEKVIEAARASGKLFMEGLWTHFLPACSRLYGLVRDQSVGGPVHLSSDFGIPATRELTPNLFAKEGGGVLLDRAVYPVSLALKVLGSIASLEAEIIRDSEDVDVHVAVQAKHENGATSQLAASMTSLLSNTTNLACTDGSISMPAPVMGAETLRIERYVPGGAGAEGGLRTALKKVPFLRALKAMAGGGGERHSYGANRYLPQLQHFLHLIEAGKTESDVVSHGYSLEVLGVLDRIRSKAR